MQRLSKGSSRLAMEAQKKFPKTPIYLVPVGINYGHHHHPLQDMHIVYGTPIDLRKFLPEYDRNAARGIKEIVETLEKEMKACLWLPEKDTKYGETKKIY